LGEMEGARRQTGTAQWPPFRLQTIPSRYWAICDCLLLCPGCTASWFPGRTRKKKTTATFSVTRKSSRGGHSWSRRWPAIPRSCHSAQIDRFVHARSIRECDRTLSSLSAS
jgi:hypothetical protein